MPRRLLIIGALLALGGCQEERPVTTAPPDPFTQQVAFAPLYPGCSYWADGGVSAGEFDQNWPDGPLLLLVPEQEDYNTAWGREPCDSMLARVPEPARRNVTLHMYPGATHGWDRQEMPASITFFDPGAAGRRGGTVRMRADGPTTADGAQRIVEFFTRSLATR